MVDPKPSRERSSSHPCRNLSIGHRSPRARGAFYSSVVFNSCHVPKPSRARSVLRLPKCNLALCPEALARVARLLGHTMLPRCRFPKPSRARTALSRPARLPVCMPQALARAYCSRNSQALARGTFGNWPPHLVVSGHNSLICQEFAVFRPILSRSNRAPASTLAPARWRPPETRPARPAWPRR